MVKQRQPRGLRRRQRRRRAQVASGALAASSQRPPDHDSSPTSTTSSPTTRRRSSSPTRRRPIAALIAGDHADGLPLPAAEPGRGLARWLADVQGRPYVYAVDYAGPEHPGHAAPGGRGPGHPHRHRARAALSSLVLILNAIRMAIFARRREVGRDEARRRDELVHPDPVHARGARPGPARRGRRRLRRPARQFRRELSLSHYKVALFVVGGANAREISSSPISSSCCSVRPSASWVRSSPSAGSSTSEPDPAATLWRFRLGTGPEPPPGRPTTLPAVRQPCGRCR